MSLNQSRLSIAAVVLVLLALIVSVRPATATLSPGQTRQFTATAPGATAVSAAPLTISSLQPGCEEFAGAISRRLDRWNGNDGPGGTSTADGFELSASVRVYVCPTAGTDPDIQVVGVAAVAGSQFLEYVTRDTSGNVETTEREDCVYSNAISVLGGWTPSRLWILVARSCSATGSAPPEEIDFSFRRVLEFANGKVSAIDFAYSDTHETFGEGYRGTFSEVQTGRLLPVIGPAVSIGDAATLEGAPGAGNALSFPVSLSAPAPAGGVTVSYGTSDGTAQAGSDYNVNSGTLTFAAGEQQKLVTVPVIGDTTSEADETVTVTLSNPTGATIADGTGVGTIINDDLVDFDWTVPDRLGLDANGDSLIDYFTTVASISPPSWRVDFVYTSGGVCDPALSPSLTIDGVVIAAGNPAIVASNAALCKISYAFPAEKKYAVKLELRNGAGATVGQVLKDVIVQDWLIVSLGDSVASGEGNPDFPRVAVGDTPVWQDRQCHRSAFAGPAQAALALERADPKTSVTFVHLACSGASIYEGILTRYRGQEPGPWGAGWIPPQVEVMDALVGTREIDAVTVSTGANDVRFAKVVTGCFLQRDCHLPTTPNSMLQFFNGWLALLPSAYDALGLTLRQPRYDVAPARTYITEYFDALRDQTGAFCDQKILEEAFDIPGLGISAGESQWASTDMMARLNQQVAAGATRSGWKYVGGIYAPFGPHGYCSTDRWIVQLTESLAGQRNPDGTIHPNGLGHALYGNRIAATLTADFYPEAGDLTKPRLPR